MDAWQIVNKYDNVIRNFYEGLMIGCNGQSYSRLYLDLQSNEIFQNVEASCNTWLYREDDSLSEIAHDNGFGFDDWLDGYLIPNVEQALADWKDEQCKK